MSAFHSFNESFWQYLPEMENFANNSIEHQPVNERSQVYNYPPQYGFAGSAHQHQPPQESYNTYQNYNTYQYNQYSHHQPYPYMYYPPPPPPPPVQQPITIVIPKTDQKVIRLEINMGVGGQNSVISIVQEKEPENLSLQAITELLEPSDYSTYYDNGTVYAEMNNVNSRELLAIEGNPILHTLETPKYVKKVVHKSSAAAKVRYFFFLQLVSYIPLELLQVQCEYNIRGFQA